ncbi:hypothetical protein SNEBB_006832 [Seison nebaliae]|nr:hypothetical protein SNEBB_006832 [Seison nebaliae]
MSSPKTIFYTMSNGVLPWDGDPVRKRSTCFPHSSFAYYRQNIYWRNMILFPLLHLAACFGLYSIFQGKVAWQTIAFMFLYNVIGIVGITAGAHRLWCHRTYKATFPLRVALIIMQTIGFQNHVDNWVADHICHHRYCDTDGDPHNASRGLFYSHIGWLLVQEHPIVTRKKKRVRAMMGNVTLDKICSFQKTCYLEMVYIFVILLPITICLKLWAESFYNAITVAVCLRICVTLHSIWTINSLAHFYGMRPFDINIKPTENMFVSLLSHGEGFHNYHHTFPRDYSASEFPTFNFTTHFINLMAMLGLAYDLHKVSKEVIHKRRRCSGDLQCRNYWNED